MSLKSASSCVPSGGDVYFNCGKNSTPVKCCSGSPSNVGGKMVCPGVSSGLCASNGGNPCVKEGGDVYYDCCRGGIDGKPVPCCPGFSPVQDSSGAFRCKSQPTPPQPPPPPPTPTPSGCPYTSYVKYTNKNSYTSSKYAWKNYGKLDSGGFTDYSNSFAYMTDSSVNNKKTPTTKFFIANQNTYIGGKAVRNSHRIETQQGFSGSNFGYKNTLVVADIYHMPEGCGTWPSFWVIGRGSEDWPSNGELDIIEMVNSVNLPDTPYFKPNTNQSTLHSYNNPQAWSKSAVNPNCYTQKQYNCSETCSTNKGSNGCCFGCLPDTVEWDSTSFGHGFNNVGGGVYAFEFDKTGSLNIWFWTRSNIPTSSGGPLTANPDPKTWKPPTATWTVSNTQRGSKMPLKNMFRDGFDLVLDTALCGDWVKSTWNAAGCNTKAANCTDYFANSNNDTSQAYWEIASINVFNENTKSSSSVGSKESYDTTQTELTTCSDSKPIKWYVVLIAVLAFILLWLVVSYFIKNKSSDPVKLGMGFMFGHDDSSW